MRVVEPGSTLDGGRYVLTELIGKGGAGQVWQATDTLLDRTVAVKLLRPALMAELGAARRFVAEGRIMSRLDHPGIAGFYDFGQDPDGTAYLVMSLVDGEPLREILAREGVLSAARTMTLVADVAEALHAAHETGVIHRDVKPGNLLVRLDGSVVLTDFGIARALGAGHTTGNLVVGTARYIAPEQAVGGEITPAVDVYALGVTAYRCLAGCAPFDRGTAIEIAERHVDTPPPPLPSVVPAPVRTLVFRLLAKNPAARPTAAELARLARDLAEDLARDPTGSAIHRAAPTTGESLDRRRRAVLVAAAAGLLVLVAAAGVMVFGPDEVGGARGSAAPGPGVHNVDPARVGAGIGVGLEDPQVTGVFGSSPRPSVLVLPPARTPLVPKGRDPVLPGPVPAPPRTSPSGGSQPATTPPSASPSPSTTPQVQVPPVVGKLETDATSILMAAGFGVSKFYEGAGDTCVVSSQDPPGGTSASPGSTVTITLPSSCDPVIGQRDLGTLSGA